MNIEKDNLKIFCTAKRPKHCFYDINLCCAFCDKVKECIELNKKENSKILPCDVTVRETVKDPCDYSI